LKFGKLISGRLLSYCIGGDTFNGIQGKDGESGGDEIAIC
jgi:hypothetical protein